MYGASCAVVFDKDVNFHLRTRYNMIILRFFRLLYGRCSCTILRSCSSCVFGLGPGCSSPARDSISTILPYEQRLVEAQNFDRVCLSLISVSDFLYILRHTEVGQSSFVVDDGYRQTYIGLHSFRPFVFSFENHICDQCRGLRAYGPVVAVRAWSVFCHITVGCQNTHWHIGHICFQVVTRNFYQPPSREPTRGSILDLEFETDEPIYPAQYDFLEPQAGFLFGEPAIHPAQSAPRINLPGFAREDTSAFTLNSIFTVFGTVRDSIFGVQALETKSFVSRFITTQETEDFVIKLVEDLLILMHNIFSSRSAYDRHVALITFAKLRGSPIDMAATALITNQLFSFVFSSPSLEVQGDTHFESARTWIDSYERVKKMAIFKKTYKFCMFLLSKGLCDKLGLDFDFFKYSKVERAAIEKDFSSSPNMIHCILDTVLFYCETGVQCFKTGSIQPIFHSGTAYEKWFDECARLKRLALHSCNLEPHGTTLFEFIENLKSAIEKGISIKKFGVLDEPEKKIVASLLDALQKIDAELLTRKKAMEERPAPFSLLICGGTSVAKSSFKELCYYHYGRVLKLPLGEGYKYTRIPGTEYWDNFKSSMWCTVVDDAAYKHPNCKEDPSVMELIQMINNVAYVPNQADLPDKGRTPFLSRLVMATTNTMHLNAYAYYSCPVAVARRFPYVVNLTLKPEYSDDQGMVDSSRMPPPSDVGFPDFWNIEILKPMKSKDNKFTHNPIQMFTSIYAFLRWYTEVIKLHEVSQINAMETNKRMVSIPTCGQCFLPHAACQCVQEELERLLPGHVGRAEELRDTEQAFAARLGVPLEAFRVLSGQEIINLLNTHPDSDTSSLCDSTLDVQSGSDVPWLEYVARQVQTYRDSLRIFRESLIERSSVWLCVRCINHESHYCDFHQTTIHFDGGVGPYDPAFEDEQTIKRESFYFQAKVWMYLRIVAWVEQHWLLCCFVCWLFGENWRWRLCRRLFSQWQSGRVLLRMLGHRIERRVGYTPMMIKLMMLTASAAVVYKLGKIVCKHFLDDYVVPQGNVQSTPRETAGVGGKPTPGEVKVVPYYFNDPFIPCNLDISQQSKCLTGQTAEQVLHRKVLDSTAMLFASTQEPGTVDRYHRIGVGLNVGMHVWLTNSHNLPAPPFFLTVKRTSQTGSITPSLADIRVSSTMLFRIPDKDLVFVNLRCIPPGYSLVEYFPGPDLEGAFNGYYLGRDIGGNEVKTPVRNITRQTHGFSCQTKTGEMIVYEGVSWHGRVSVDTKHGDCGSALVTVCNGGSMILGLHLLGGSQKKCVAVSIDRETLRTVVQQMSGSIFERSEIPMSGPSAPRELGPIHPKSPVLFTQGGFANVFGSFKGFRIGGKSHVCETLICKSVEKRGYIKKCAKPDMGYMPFWHALQDLTQPNVLMDMDVLEECKKAYLSEVYESLPASELAQVMVFDEDTAINGMPGVQYCDKMNRNTSVGAPYKKTKRLFMHPIESEIGLERVEFNEEISTRIDDVLRSYKKNKMFHPQFSGNRKDEPIKLQKCKEKKTRIFCSSEAAWSVIVRMYFLSIVMVMERNKFVFEGCPGAIAQCLEWEEMLEFLRKQSLERMFAGDFAKFDKRMAAALVLMAFDILIDIAQTAGFSEESLKIMKGIALDTAFSVVDFDGDLIQFFGSNPSGHPLTVIINCIVVSLYMRYCYSVLHQRMKAHVKYGLHNFRQYVSLLTYGDDNVASVSEEIPWFNHTAVQQVLREVGIDYTMADKEAASVPYISIDECTFLKRSWRFDSEIDAWVAPLAEASIAKMLTVCVAKKTVCPEVRDVNAISTALREYFFFGRVIFEQKTVMFREIIAENHLEEYVVSSTFPTWWELYEAFWKSSRHVKLKLRTPDQCL